MKILLPLMVLMSGLLSPAAAQEPHMATAVFCDRPEQIEAVAAKVADGSTVGSAVATVDGSTKACAVENILYLQGDTVKVLRTKNGYGQIMEIFVIGVIHGRLIRVRPVKQYILYESPKLGV